VTRPSLEDQVAELRRLCPSLLCAPEGERALYLLPQLHLPDGCAPAIVDALLCPFERDGYAFRVFFAEKIATPISLNWNFNGNMILDRKWFGFSWKVPGELRLIQMVSSILGAMV
jgi:hypothetical protein